MIISCPQCLTKFVVKPNAIGTTGRRVKCTKCKHDWFQQPAAEGLPENVIQDDPTNTDPIPEGSNLPDVIAKQKAPVWLKIAASVALVITFLSYVLLNGDNIIRNHKWLSSIYALFNLYDTEGISLANISTQKIHVDDHEELIVIGKIANKTEFEKKLPEVRILLMNDNNQALKAIMLGSSDTIIKAGEEIEFRNKIPAIPEKATKMTMDIGSPFELKLR